jgi:hypothetical protein
MRSLAYNELFIGGRWQAPSNGQRLTVISPHTEEPIGETPEAGPGDVDKAVTAARKAFDDGPWPRLNHSSGWRRSRSSPRSTPATWTRWPTSSPQRWAHRAASAGSDRRPGRRRKCTSPWRRRANFPGSKGDRACSATGRRIAALCGEQLKRVSLELGGKSAAIILDDADIAARWRRRRQRGRGAHERRRTSCPFGGFKQSGIGREFGAEGLSAYTELQSTVSAGKLPELT